MPTAFEVSVHLFTRCQGDDHMAKFLVLGIGLPDRAGCCQYGGNSK